MTDSTSLGRSGLDTLTASPQTTQVRSTTEEDDAIECEHARVERDDDGEFGRRFFCLDCLHQVMPDGPDEDGQGYWEVID